MSGDVPESGEAFELELLLDRLGGDAELVREMAALYLQDKDATLKTMRELAAARDGTELAVRVHALKGVALNFECPGLRLVAASAERALVAGRLGTALSLLPAVEREAEALADSLRRYLASAT